MGERLELQVKHGSTWQTLNRREVGEVSYGTAFLDLLTMRDQWLMNEFPNHSFRVIEWNRGKWKVVMGKEVVG